MVKDNVPENKETDLETLRALRHDIKNQLSNIYLAIEQLRYELPDVNADCQFYLDSIATSAAKINAMLSRNE